jgi:hypothetical protein
MTINYGDVREVTPELIDKAGYFILAVLENSVVMDQNPNR